MAITAQKVLDKASEYIGIKESPANSNKVLFTVKYGVITAWCGIFIKYVFDSLGGGLLPDVRTVMSCSKLMAWAKEQKHWVTSDYKPGDIVMFNFDGASAPKHMGIVVSYNKAKKQIVSIDGNTGSGSAKLESDGGMVAKRTRTISGKTRIIGAVRPKYDKEETTVRELEKPVSVTLTQIYRGSKLPCVKTLQRQLNAKGYTDDKNAPLEVDGSFGAATEAAFIKFQKANALNADGYCGAKSWEKALN